MNKWIISDLHLGHNKILKFSPLRLGNKVDSVEEHDTLLEVRWAATVRPGDIVYVLGDVAFKAESLERFKNWPGKKILVRGNHDNKSEELYRSIFHKILGLAVMDGAWFSHAPVHPTELRGRPNIHGHVHQNIIRDHYHQPDKRYRPVCVEQNQGWPEPYERVLKEANDAYPLQ